MDQWMNQDPYLTVAAIMGVARANVMQPDPKLHTKRRWEHESVEWMKDVEHVFHEIVAFPLQDTENFDG